MADLASRLSLRSPVVSYLATTAFNFTSISLLLWVAYSSIESRVIATIVAHVIGMILSMVFCLDFWWTRVSLQMGLPVTAKERARFLGIATIAVLIATAIIGAVPSGDSHITPALIALNWMALAAVSIGKYIVMILLVPRRRGVTETLAGICTVAAGVLLAPIWYVAFPLSFPLCILAAALIRPATATATATAAAIAAEAGAGNRMYAAAAGFSLFARIPPAVIAKGVSWLFPSAAKAATGMEHAGEIAVAAGTPEGRAEWEPRAIDR